MAGFFLRAEDEGTVGLTRLPLDVIRCKHRAKSRSGKLVKTAEIPYSKRRISTGRSRAAALAGTMVAPMEITIAASEIQIPSRKLG